MSLQQLRQELSSWLTSLGAGHVSKDFFELIKNIGEARSKQEERQIIQKEAQTLKSQFSSPDNTGKRMKELLVRALYCEMLGQEVPFAYVHALTMTQQPRLIEKRVGYLVAALCLTRHNEFRMLITNSFRRDLESTNHLDVCCALTAMVDLLTVETIPALLEPLNSLLTRPNTKAIVRKKIVHVLNRCLELWEKEREKEPEDNELYTQECQMVMQQLYKLLCDTDPSVMMSVVGVLWPRIVKEVEKNPSVSSTSLTFLPGSSSRSLLGAFLSIQKQILDRHLRDYDYHQVSAPWLQIALLKILCALGSRDVQAARDMYHILNDTLSRCVNELRTVTTTTMMGAPPSAPILDVAAHNALYAVLYETIRTITHVYATHRQLMEGNKAIAALVEEAANHISQMLHYSTGQVSGTNSTRTSGRNQPPRNPNVQYVALQCLTEIIALSPRYATPHQLVLMQCLYDPDESIQRTTLELLCKMTTVSNVVVVVEQLLIHLQRQTDIYLRTELIQRITSLAEKFAPSPEWYIKVMLRTLRVGGDLITLRHPVVPHLIHALRTGTGDSDMTRTLRTHALTQALDHLSALSSGESLPDILILTIAWIVGEYGHLHSTLSPSAILELLGDLLERQYILDDVRVWIGMAIQKRLTYMYQHKIAIETPLRVWNRLRRYALSRHLLTQQLCDEILTMTECFTSTAAADRIQMLQFSVSELEVIPIDTSLPFLESYTQQALTHNARPYQPVDVTGDVATHLSGYSTAPLSHLNSRSTRSGRRSSSGLKYTSYGLPPSAQLPTRSGLHSNTSTSSPSLFDISSHVGSGSALLTPDSSFLPPTTTTSASLPLSGLTTLKNVSGPWSAQGYNIPKRESLFPSVTTSTSTSESNIETMSTPTPYTPTRTHEVKSSGESGSSPHVRQSPAAVVSRPRTKEERLAARLFQGVSENVSDSTTPSLSTPTTGKTTIVSKRTGSHLIDTTTTTTATATATATTTTFSSSPTRSVTSTSTSSISTSLIPTFDESQRSTSSSLINVSNVTSSPTPTLNQTTSSDTLLLNVDLLSASPSTSSTSTNSTVAASSSSSSSSLSTSLTNTTVSSSSSGLFEHISLPAPILATQRQSVGEWRDNFDYDNLTPTPLILREIDGKPRSHPTGQIVVNETELRVAYFNVWNDESVSVVLFITNKRDSELSNITLDLTPPTNFQVSYQADSVVDLSQSSMHKVHIVMMPARTTVLVLLTLTPTHFTIHPMTLSVIVSYKSGSSSHNEAMRIFKFLVPIEVVDLLRAKEITLESYSQQWPIHTAEEKLSVRHSQQNSSTSASVMSMDSFITSLKSWHFHPVKVIGKEVVSCARFLRTVNQPSSSEESLVLLHSKVDTSTQTVDFKVRTKDKILTELVIRFLNHTFKKQ